MKSRTSLVLMEQLVMILVFALAAALCLQVFVKADQLSEEILRQDEAMILARNAAQLLKATGGEGDPASLSRDGYRLEIRREPSGIPGLGQAEVAVLFEEKQLVSLTVGWQEELP